MKKLFLLLSLVAGFAHAGPVYTPGSARISSPIALTTVHADNIPVSFSAVCPGGPYVLKWAFDSGTGPFTTVTFYDSISINFMTKLPVGRHSLTVISPCGWTGTTFDVVP